MQAKLQDIITAVRKVIDDQAPQSGTFLADENNDDTYLNQIIEQKAVEAADFVHLNTEISRLSCDTQVVIKTEGSTGTISGATTRYTVAVTVDNMLRFLKFTNTNRAQTITSVIEEGTEEYALAMDSVVGACAEKPAVLYRNTGYSRTLTWVALSSPSDVIISTYIKRAEIFTSETDKCILIDSNIYPQYINYLAGVTLLTLGDSRANNIIGLALTQLGIQQ